MFRRLALDKLGSPERTDRPLRLIGAPGWMALTVFFVAVAAGVAFGLGVRAPIKVAGDGLLIDAQGLTEIAAASGGRIRRLEIAPGDVIEAGEVVAVFDRSDLARELDAAQALLEDLRMRAARRATAHEARSMREAEIDGLRRRIARETRTALDERLALLRERAANLAPLAARGTIPAPRLIEAQVAVSDVEERLAALAERDQAITVAAAERAAEREFEQLDDRLAIDQQERAVARLRARLDDAEVLRAQAAGRVVEVQVDPGEVIAAGAALATLGSAQSGRDLEVILFVPPGEGKRIASGMRAEVVPSTVEREVYGHLRATVSAVAPLPATPAGMRRVLRNDQLVRQLSAGGAPIEVRLRLERAPTPTGLSWSASDGPDSGVEAGTLVTGRVVVETKPLIDLVIPGAAAMLGLDRS